MQVLLVIVGADLSLRGCERVCWGWLVGQVCSSSAVISLTVSPGWRAFPACRPFVAQRPDRMPPRRFRVRQYRGCRRCGRPSGTRQGRRRGRARCLGLEHWLDRSAPMNSARSGVPLDAPYACPQMGEKTTCAIIGGGPAGMVLGLLLARAGVEVTLLEKHGDFLRDFRGDTVHPTTMRLLDELGLWERFAELPFSEVRKATLDTNGHSVTYIDFGRLNQPHPYVAMVPQWDLFNLLAEAAQAEPSFTLRMNTEVAGLLQEGGRVTGVRYQGAEGPGELRAELTVACDGRWSIARQAARLKARDYPVNFDVW